MVLSEGCLNLFLDEPSELFFCFCRHPEVVDDNFLKVKWKKRGNYSSLSFFITSGLVYRRTYQIPIQSELDESAAMLYIANDSKEPDPLHNAYGPVHQKLSNGDNLLSRNLHPQLLSPLDFFSQLHSSPTSKKSGRSGSHKSEDWHENWVLGDEQLMSRACDKKFSRLRTHKRKYIFILPVYKILSAYQSCGNEFLSGGQR